MLIYILFFLMVFGLLQFEKLKIIKGVNFYGLAYFIIFLFSAIRFDVGYDFPMYYNFIKGEMKFIDDQLNRLEFLSRKLIDFSHDTGFFQLFFIVSSFVVIYLTYKTLKRNSKDFTLSTLVFLSFPIFFLNSLTIIRQYIAVSIVFYSVKFIKSRKLFPFILSIFIAFLFHKSAIIAITLYWIYNIKLKSIHFIIIYFVGLIFSDLAYIFVKYLQPQYLIYLERGIGSGGDKLLLIFKIIGFFVLFLVNKKRENLTYNFYMISFFIGLFIWSSLAPYGHAGFRGAMYFIVFFILLLPEVYEIIKERKILRVATYFVCFSFFIFTLWLGTKNPNKDPNIPYRIYFLTDKSDFKSDKR